MSATRRRSQPRPSAATVAIAAVVLLGQAGAWVHAAATPHVTCLEHGERVHLAVATAAAPAHPRGDVTGIAATTEPDAHAHEHCGLQGQRTTSAGTPAHDSSVATFAPARLPAIADQRPALRLLRLAPKTSPPRTPAA